MSENPTYLPNCLFIGRRSYQEERRLKQIYHLIFTDGDDGEIDDLIRKTRFAYFHFGAHPDKEIPTLRLLRRLQYTPSIIICGADSDGQRLDYRDLKALTRNISKVA